MDIKMKKRERHFIIFNDEIHEGELPRVLDILNAKDFDDACKKYVKKIGKKVSYDITIAEITEHKSFSEWRKVK